jgi:UDP:flavonoid glycosyltransferase YjiC (YdhE family)
LPDQPFFAAQLKRLKVGVGRRFSATTEKTLVKDLRRILGPDFAVRARAMAPQMTERGDSVAAAADQVEKYARLTCHT